RLHGEVIKADCRHPRGGRRTRRPSLQPLATLASFPSPLAGPGLWTAAPAPTPCRAGRTSRRQLRQPVCLKFVGVLTRWCDGDSTHIRNISLVWGLADRKSVV